MNTVWEVWSKNYLPAFDKLLGIYATKKDAEMVARNLVYHYWDEEEGECGLEVRRRDTP